MYLELFAQKFRFFTPWEVLEFEYLNNKRDKDKVSPNKMIIKFNNTILCKKITVVCHGHEGTSISREYSLTQNMFIAIILIVPDYTYVELRWLYSSILVIFFVRLDSQSPTSTPFEIIS